jgi:2-haloacid dehalogenase
MEEVRSARRPFVRLDLLHRENLEALLPEFAIDPTTVPAGELDALTSSGAGLTLGRIRFPA